MFTLGEDGETTVKPFEAYDDTYEKVLKNVAIGTGVILVCVTVSVVTAGAGAPAISMIFAASAKTGTVMALSSGAMGGTAAGIVTGVKTKDFNQAMKAAALAGSEGFKMGAISGAIAGGATEAVALKGATLNGLSMNDAAIMQKEGYPLDVIKQFNSMDQFEVCKKAGLKPAMLDGKTALLKKIDLTNTITILICIRDFPSVNFAEFNGHNAFYNDNETMTECHSNNCVILRKLLTCDRGIM